MINKGIIYKVTCLLNNKIYVGKTISFEKRKMQHLKNNKPKTYFDKALKKYGHDNFVWEVLEEAEIDKLAEREQYWIKILKATEDNGFNLTVPSKIRTKCIERFIKFHISNCNNNFLEAETYFKKNNIKMDRRTIYDYLNASKILKEINNSPKHHQSYYSRFLQEYL